MSDSAAFNQRGLTILIAFGLVCAVLFALLTAYAPTLDKGRNGGAHGLSISGTGYSAIVALTAAAGDDGRVGRDERVLAQAGLLVLTPEMNVDGEEVARLVRERQGAPVLLVLPKWRTVVQPLRPGWVDRVTQVPPGTMPMLRYLQPEVIVAGDVIKPGAALNNAEVPGMELRAPKLVPRSLTGMDPVLTDAAGHIVLGWNAKHNLYVLAEPDLINNQGVRDLTAARGAVELLAMVGAGRPGGVVFDVTLNGFGRGRSLIRNAFEPPFLALTLSLLTAAALACWYGLVRFGAPQAEGRAIAFGKRALVDNTAGLIRMAGREAGMAPRYAAVMRERAAVRLHAPGGLSTAALDDWLAQRGGGDFTGLVQAAEAASGGEAALAAAQAIHEWQEKIVDDRR